MMSLYQDEIIKLNDKRLQLRYMLGGLYPHGNMQCDIYWACDIRCSTKPVPDDDKLQKVIDFINEHNISNETFIRLARTYLCGHFNAYKGDFGMFIPKLDRVLLDYHFTHTNDAVQDNDLKEKELLSLICKSILDENSDLYKFLEKYSLNAVDFMILAKTSVNYQFKIVRGTEKSDLTLELQNILEANDLYQSYEWVIEYRKMLSQTENNNKHMSWLKRIRKK